ncbi:MAG: SatD family protein [Eubacteriales bacterium]|nr:SatD family protein [Eubacteriales bacterium]
MDYTAIIGDIKESKTIENRSTIQKKLKHALDCVNERYHADISAKFIITLGDEFQGLLRKNEHLLDIIQYIQREMYPVRLRFGIGIGEISTDLFYEAAIGADGPAYYAARAMIEELREQEKKIRKQASDIQISIYHTESFEITEINTILALMKVIEEEWSDKQRYTIWDMTQNGGSQEECARRMETTQSTVARRLVGGNYITYERAKRTVDEAIKRLGDLNGS